MHTPNHSGNQSIIFTCVCTICHHIVLTLSKYFEYIPWYSWLHTDTDKSWPFISITFKSSGPEAIPRAQALTSPSFRNESSLGHLVQNFEIIRDPQVWNSTFRDDSYLPSNYLANSAFGER